MTKPHDHDTHAPEDDAADAEGPTTGPGGGADGPATTDAEARPGDDAHTLDADAATRRFDLGQRVEDDGRLDVDGYPAHLSHLIALERTAATEPAPPDDTDGDRDGDSDDDGEGSHEETDTDADPDDGDASDATLEGAPTTDGSTPDTTPAPELSMDLSPDPIRLRIREMINGTAAPGPLAPDATDAQVVALRRFLDALPDEATYTTWQKGLSEAERARTLAILHDPRALTVFGTGWKEGDPLMPDAAGDDTAAATVGASLDQPSAQADAAPAASAPSTPGDAVNQQIAKRFARVGSKAGTPRTTAGAPAARPGRPGAPSAVVATPRPIAAPAAKPGKCARGCRLNHTHRF